MLVCHVSLAGGFANRIEAEPALLQITSSVRPSAVFWSVSCFMNIWGVRDISVFLSLLGVCAGESRLLVFVKTVRAPT